MFANQVNSNNTNFTLMLNDTFLQFHYFVIVDNLSLKLNTVKPPVYIDHHFWVPILVSLSKTYLWTTTTCQPRPRQVLRLVAVHKFDHIIQNVQFLIQFKHLIQKPKYCFLSFFDRNKLTIEWVLTHAPIPPYFFSTWNKKS